MKDYVTFPFAAGCSVRIIKYPNDPMQRHLVSPDGKGSVRIGDVLVADDVVPDFYHIDAVEGPYKYITWAYDHIVPCLYPFSFSDGIRAIRNIGWIPSYCVEFVEPTAGSEPECRCQTMFFGHEPGCPYDKPVRSIFS